MSGHDELCTHDNRYWPCICEQLAQAREQERERSDVSMSPSSAKKPPVHLHNVHGFYELTENGLNACYCGRVYATHWEMVAHLTEVLDEMWNWKQR